MTRALIAVGALLTTAFIILGLVVYLTRSEDRVSADNTLAENLTRAIQVSDTGGDGRVDLRRIAPFRWDRVLVVQPGTARETQVGAPATEQIERGDLARDLDRVQRIRVERGRAKPDARRGLRR